MRAIAIAVALAGCWRGGSSTTSDPPATKPSRVPWKPGSGAEPTGAQFAESLANEVRSAPSRLGAFVLIPVISLDLDTGIVATNCDQNARDLAQRAGALLADPARPPPRCHVSGDRFTCTQYTPNDVVILELSEPRMWRLHSVIIGNTRNARLIRTNGALIRTQVANQIANPTCP